MLSKERAAIRTGLLMGNRKDPEIHAH